MAGLHILSPSFLFLGLSFAELLKVQIDEADGPTDQVQLTPLPTADAAAGPPSPSPPSSPGGVV